MQRHLIMQQGRRYFVIAVIAIADVLKPVYNFKASEM